MRNAAVYAGLLVTSFSALGHAMVNLTILSSVKDVHVGDHLLVEWATDQTYVSPYRYRDRKQIRHTDKCAIVPRLHSRQEGEGRLVYSRSPIRRPSYGSWPGQYYRDRP